MKILIKKINIFFSFFNPEDLKKVPKKCLKVIKVPSGEITNLPLLRKISQLTKKIILYFDDIFLNYRKIINRFNFFS